MNGGTSVDFVSSMEDVLTLSAISPSMFPMSVYVDVALSETGNMISSSTRGVLRLRRALDRGVNGGG